MRRMSSLPIAQYCAKAPELDVGAGRAAAMSTAFHALCDDQAKGNNASKETETKLAKLTAAEIEEIKTWRYPEDFVVLGIELRYSEAETEVTCALGQDGEHIDGDTDKAITVGHADMFWVIRAEIDGEEVKVVVVGDIKKSAWTTIDGPSSLQLSTYGFALAQKTNADYFVPCIWIAEDGTWLVGDPVSMYSLEASKLWSKIHHAATHQSDDFATGPHCTECWSRLQCPAHMVRYGDVLVVPGTLESELDQDSALELIRHTKQLEDTAKAAKDYLKEWVRRNGEIPDGNGKKWGPVRTNGREMTASPKKLRESLGEEAEMFIFRSKPSEQFRWHKA